MAVKPKLCMIPSGYKGGASSGDLYSVLPSDGTGDFDFSRSGSATRINKDGLIETVDSNVPRLNYPLIDGVVSGCPSLLLEPASTNLITYSNDFLDSSWDVFRGSVTADVIISPDGTQNASRYEEDSQTGSHLFRRQSLSITNGLSYTGSIFIKKGELTSIILQSNSSSRWVASATFDVENGVVTSGTGEIEYYGNGWYRCSISGNAVETTTVAGLEMYTSVGAGRDGDGLYMYGAMFEQGSFPTSYIPSLIGSQTTRSAETCNNAGNSNVFNDSEGVLMFEGSFNEDLSYKAISISDGNINNSLRIYSTLIANQLVFRVRVGNVDQMLKLITLQDISQINKLSLKYKENDFNVYINGFKVASDTSGSVYSDGTLDRLNLDRYDGLDDFYGKTKQLQYFNTALTDAELEKLTSYDSFRDMAIAGQYKTY